MRWVKHLSMAHTDEEVDRILEKFGAIAYGVFWLIIEDIASGMDAGKMVPRAVHSRQKWAQIARVPPRVLTSQLQEFGKKLLNISVTGDDRIQIEAPNILKYKDEYSKKSGVTPELKAELKADLKTEAAAERFPLAAARIRFFHPATDDLMISRLIDLIKTRYPDADDECITEILHKSHQGKRQRGPALWLSTLPEYLNALLGNSHKPVAPVTPEELAIEDIVFPVLSIEEQITDSRAYLANPDLKADDWSRRLMVDRLTALLEQQAAGERINRKGPGISNPRLELVARKLAVQ